MLKYPDVFSLRSSGPDGLTAVQGHGGHARNSGCSQSRKA